jgi:hypothetical protein
MQVLKYHSILQCLLQKDSLIIKNKANRKIVPSSVSLYIYIYTQAVHGMRAFGLHVGTGSCPGTENRKE